MATSDRSPATLPGPAVEPRWALVERVLGSPSLQTSPRLQALFRYLAERALQDPPAPLSESQVGVAVFQRAPDYDTSVDTIVRVQVSQLRKKLEHYFLSEGRDEPIVIELRRGSYMPVFVPRARPEEPPELTPAGVVSAGPPAVPVVDVPPRRPRTTLALLAVALILAAGLLIDDVRLRGTAAPLPARPHVDHFWREFFDNHLPTQVVVSDQGLMILEETLERPIPLSEYRQASYPKILETALPGDARMKALLLRTAVRGLTTPNEAIVVHQLAATCQRQQALCQVLSAKDLRLNLQAPENIVLLGHKRANPWQELFEGGMNFRYRFDDTHRTATIVNQAPAPDEPAIYQSDWGRQGYCVVAYMPKPGGGGHVLLIFGADLQSVEAGGHFISDESSMALFHQRLGIGLRDRVPYVEVLLHTKLQGTATASYELIAHRLVKG
jgi:hypothetical protein